MRNTVENDLNIFIVFESQSCLIQQIFSEEWRVQLFPRRHRHEKQAEAGTNGQHYGPTVSRQQACYGCLPHN